MIPLERAFAERDGNVLLRAALHDSPDAVVVADDDRRVVGLNEAAEQLFGWRLADVVGRTLDVFHAEPAHGRDLEESSDPGTAGRGDRRLRRSGGEVFIGETAETPICDDGGRSIGMLVTIRDVTNDRRTLRAMSELYSVISSRELCYQDKVERILEIGAATFGTSSGMVCRVDGEAVTVCHTYDGEQIYQPGQRLSAARSFCGEVLRRNTAVACHHVGASELRHQPFYDDGLVESGIGAPLNVDGERFGTVSFLSPEPRAWPFSEQDVDFVRLLSEWIGNEIARERDLQALRAAHERLRALASTDELTGVGSRRHFMDLARHDWERTRRNGRPLSMLVVDLDHFRKVNETHGHAAGDELLAAVAGACRRVLRAADVFARIGGEEFAVLLPEAGEERALEVAERLRAAIGEVTVDGADAGASVTASIGAVTAGEADSDVRALMARADEALERAKERGRNRVETI
ncbi:bifunctional diguanylate cyclase/phosphodiesterase [Engelhardtia mirabilis]|uniref:diguanylate cyclase n=1 Tax=Engelhardtia mirabilis TaxID=2528011 RepID=A0A518BGC1_9BACT|nr:putative diguanylate cyclase AdrA [Planctomycetes bacterium Pla133]QDV00355.1 putative diguanylate cyclase AdrA [Planctomycetes bacterium Pla86]